MLHDAVVDEQLVGNSLRLGAGLDVHLDEFAIGARYLSSFYGFVESEAGVYPDELSAHTESVGLQLTVYF